MSDSKVTPLFTDRPIEGIAPDTEDVVRELRELADDIERGLRVTPGVVLAYRDHHTRSHVLTLGRMTYFEQMGLLTIAQRLAMDELLGG